MPRIISGTAKGVQLKVPQEARPIGDRAKSALFSIIGSDIIDKKILDLYAGSGSLGLEALSRGAAHCTFVESSIHAVRSIRENTERAGLDGQAQITHQKVIQFLNEQTETYDIVFADPPYKFYKDRSGRAETLINSISEAIPEGGAIVLKHPSVITFSQIPGLYLADQRVYGTNTVSLWVKIPDGNVRPRT